MGGRLVALPPIPSSPLLTTIPPCPAQGGSLHNLERKHGRARNHCPARPSLRLATAWCWSGSSGYRLWRTEEEEEVWSCGAWGAARPRWVLGQAAGAGAPPTHRQKPPGRPTQPTRCLCQALNLTRDESNPGKNISLLTGQPGQLPTYSQRKVVSEEINLVGCPWQMPS